MKKAHLGMKQMPRVWKVCMMVWNKWQMFWNKHTFEGCPHCTTNGFFQDGICVVWDCFVPFRTVFVWCGFVLYHLYCLQVYWYTNGTSLTTKNGSKIVLCANNCRPQMELFCTIETFFVPQSDSIAHFMFQGSFFIPAGTKKVSLVRNPLESFESSEKLGG
jgi:hypothetical protein